MVHGAGVGGFLRVVYGRGEGGSKVVGAVLLDVDESCEAYAVGLGNGCDQVGKLAAVVMQEVIGERKIKWIFGKAYVLKSRFTPGEFTALFTPSEFGRLFALRSST